MTHAHNNNNPQSPLVHLSLSAQLNSDNQVTQLNIEEQPFIGDLQLNTDPDNLSLLIAVGDMMGVQQPLTASRISCFGSLAIIWLDQQRWLALPAPGLTMQPLQALKQAFGQDLQVEHQADSTRIRLNQAAVRYLLDSHNTREEHQAAVERRQQAADQLIHDGIELLPLTAFCHYDLLVRRSCADQLWQWLDGESHTQAAHG